MGVVMKIQSQASEKWYVVGCVTLDVSRFGVDPERFVHVQATEQLPGYASRSYGSSFNLRVGKKVKKALVAWAEAAKITPTVSLRGTGCKYITCQIEEGGRHVQIVGVPPFNRGYGVALDEKPPKK